MSDVMGLRRNYETDVLIIGGGSAGTMAAIKAKERFPGLNVTILEKAHIRRSGAIAMGMDGLNNAVIPGKATPEEYVWEITRANDGILDQRTVLYFAREGYSMVKELDSWGVKFSKDDRGDFIVHKVHMEGRYVVPMPEGSDLKRILYKKVKSRHITTINRVMATSILTRNNRVVGVTGLNVFTGEFVVIKASAVILTTGAAGRLGLPATGYLYGTYENPTNAGDGYAMAYRAGAQLTSLEAVMIVPLLKDYNGPACAYVAGPYGGYTADPDGERLTGNDYWSGELIMHMYQAKQRGQWPAFLKLDHLPEKDIAFIEHVLHSNERPSRDRFHAQRGTNYRHRMLEMSLSEPSLCSGHSASGILVDEQARTTLEGLYAAGDVASVPHQYLLGAFVIGKLAGESAALYAKGASSSEPDPAQIDQEYERVYRPLHNSDGYHHEEVEYKIRRTFSQYSTPPKSGTMMNIGMERFRDIRMQDIPRLSAHDPHELGRTLEVPFILDCAEMSTMSSLYRKESRWGFLHYRLDYPTRDDVNGLYRTIVGRTPEGTMMVGQIPVPDPIITDKSSASAQPVNK